MKTKAIRLYGKNDLRLEEFELPQIKEDEILAQIGELVSMLPLNNEGDVYTEECEDDLNRACASMDVMKGDARYLLSEISDGHAFFETKADYAKNMVTGFIKLNGRCSCKLYRDP